MYWTLDTRPPTLDERILQAKARHAERVEQIAAEEPVPQLEVPEVRQSVQIGPTFTVRPGHYFEVSEEQMRAYQERMQRSALERIAAQQNMGMNGLQYGAGLVPLSNPWAAQQSLASLGSMAQHPFFRF